MQTTRQVANEYRVSQRTVWRWIERGELAAVNVGTAKRTQWRISRAAIEDMLAQRASRRSA